MKRTLRLLLILLVLENLAFVQITDAADLVWLGPLVGLTLASPLLLALRRYLTYRLLWNLAVLGVFGLLVRHAATAGIQFLLEDGLLLAALCQVHLLNNIGPDQKPDLIFFNSFLIAVVTSFLSLDLGYSVVFVLYAPTLVLALQVYVLTRTDRTIRPAVLRGALLTGTARAGAVLGITLLLFFLLPRDFSRRGLIGDRLAWRSGNLLQTGFDDEVQLGRTGRKVGDGDRVVLTVEMKSGNLGVVPTAWRGATLARFDGRNWRAYRGSFVGNDAAWMPTGVGEWIRRQLEPGPVVLATLRDPSSGRLFAPLTSRRVRVVGGEARRVVDAAPDLTLLYPAGARSGEPVSYEVELSSKRPVLGGAVGAGARRVSPVYRTIGAGSVPAPAMALAHRLRQEAGGDAPQHRVVERMRDWLASHYQWLPPGSPEGAKSLVEFFQGGRGAHCEYFATALAVMLRSEGIPCRLVTGYRSEEWDESNHLLTFRDRHAHAWVEVYDPHGGWYTVDPSPPADDTASSEGVGLAARIRAAIGRIWGVVTNFSEDGRQHAIAWVLALPGRTLRLAGRRPLPFAGIALLLAGLLLARSLGRGREPSVVREYRRAVRKARLLLRPGETPRELLARARARVLRPARLRALESATGRHEAERFAPSRDR